MAFALELHGVSKHFMVGTAGCTGTVHALRDVHVEIRPGEAVAVVGAAGAGKSTLLLCAAGLLRPDRGDVRWFGSTERDSAIRRAAYHFAGSFAPHRRGAGDRGGAARLHLVDGPDARRLLGERSFRRWLTARCDRGDAVVIAARTADEARDVVGRTIVLRAGRIQGQLETAPARVAESRAVGEL